MACALDEDIATFEAGDLTLVGERGITLRSVCLVWKFFIDSRAFHSQRRPKGSLAHLILRRRGTDWILQARLTLARAVYSTAKILLLDDILSAVDIDTANHLVKCCFQGELLEDRTVILVVSTQPRIVRSIA